MCLIRRCSLILIALLFSACSIGRASRLVGLGKEDVIAAYGPPNQILNSESGGEIWVYTRTGTDHTFTPPAMAAAPQAPVSAGFKGAFVQGLSQAPQSGFASSSTYTSHRMFWISPQGLVTKTSRADN